MFLSPPPENLLKRDPGTLLYRFRLGSGRVLLKRYLHASPWLALRARLFPSRARREFAALCELRGRGIPTLEPVACGEEDHGPMRRGSFLATVFLEGAMTLEAFLDSWPPRAERDRVLGEVAALVRRMHEAGLAHGTLFPRNIMLPGAPGSGPLVFDAPHGRFHPGPVPEAARADDLACLYRFCHPWITAGEKARFLGTYLGRAPTEGLGPAGRRLAGRILASAAFTRSWRRKLAFHLRRWTGRPHPRAPAPPRPRGPSPGSRRPAPPG